jgi:hypothetical protein
MALIALLVMMLLMPIGHERVEPTPAMSLPSLVGIDGNDVEGYPTGFV